MASRETCCIVLASLTVMDGMKNDQILGLMAATVYDSWVVRNEGVESPRDEQEAVELAARLLQRAMNREARNPLIASMVG